MANLSVAAAAQVKVWQGTIALPAYEEGAPDPNPPFDVFATTEFNYPYTMRTILTGQKRDHVWRALFLENEYLKCTVLPDLGGHLYTCMDKLSGQSMFYANSPIKKAEIGHRGAWAAFGVEYNFPVSHNWVSLSPIDFTYTKHTDGSASVIVGNIDRPYGMQWQVELTLQPHSTLLAEHVRLYNRSAVRHRFYWWDNAGVRVWDDSRIEYPMRFVASHGFTDVYHWPVLNPPGRDLSLVGNHTDGPVSYFSHGSHETFMGIWSPKTQAGVAQVSAFQDLPSKKIWSWGSDPAGLEWRNALSDDDSAYVEVQAGLFRNQETYAFLEPGQTIQFSEDWMPLRGTGGISRANQAGVLELHTVGTTTTAALNVNRAIPNARISLRQGSNRLWTGTVDLSPEKTWSRSVPVDLHAGPVSFDLEDASATMLLTQTEGQYVWDLSASIKTGPQPTFPYPAPDARTEDQWLTTGTDQELNGQLLLALDTYRSGLKRFPESQSLRIACGRLAATLQHYAEALPLLKAAQARDTPNSVVSYYVGLAEQGIGDLRAAETDFDIAYRQSAFRAPAALRLAQLSGTSGDRAHASQLLAAASGAEPLNVKAAEQAEALARAAADIATADQLAHMALKLDPTSDFIQNDLGSPDLPHLAADPYRVLRIAAEYMEIGLYKPALAVLDRDYPTVPPDQAEPGSLLPQAHPLVGYYAALCRQRLHLDARASWKAASSRSIAGVFPNTEMDRIALETALTADPQDATAHELLGTQLFSEGLYGEGMAHWAEAKRLAPALPLVDADLGHAWLDLKGNPEQAIPFFETGVVSDPTNPEIYIGLDESMSVVHRTAKERAYQLARYPGIDIASTEVPSGLVYQLALTRAEAGQFAFAQALFQGRFFPRKEGGISSDKVMLEVTLMQAEAETVAGNCHAAQALLSGQLARLSTDGASSNAHLRMSNIAQTCHDKQQAWVELTLAAAGKTYADRVWAMKARQTLGTAASPEAESLALIKALPPAANLTEKSNYTSYHWYGVGLLQASLHQDAQARQSFTFALLLPDEWMSHHLARQALATLPE